LVVSGELMFASMGASIRFAAQTLPNEMVVFLRNLLGIALLLPWFWYRGAASLATRVPHLHLLRGLAGLGKRI
jgi:drug/metabolite transporter (DMT)-like permease